MSTNNSSSTLDDASSSSGEEADTKLIVRTMFGVAAALTLFTGAFFAHVWIYRVRRLREREEGARASGGGEGGRTRTSFFGRTNGFISDVWTYVQKVRLANTLHKRFRDATEADLKGSGEEEDGRSDSCAICLGKMVASPATIDALKPQVLLCGHVYHRTCLRSWLDKESFSCPICRASVWTGKEQKIEEQIEMNSSSNREGGGENNREEEGENASGDGSSGEREQTPPRRAFGGSRNDYRSIAANILSG